MSEEIAREILSLETLMPSEYEDKPLRKSVFRGDMAEKAPDLARAYLELLEENERITGITHRLEIHPDYEYAKTTGYLVDSDGCPPEGEGWEQNVHRGRDGWVRFEYHEEAYWMRRLKEIAGE